MPDQLTETGLQRRGLFRDRSFTLTTVATLTVALSLVTVVFAVFNAYVLRPYAVRDQTPYARFDGARSRASEPSADVCSAGAITRS